MTISSQTVSVSISLGTRAPNSQSFGTPAIFAKTPYVGGRLYELSPEGLASMVTDGFTVNDRAYKLVSSMASQSPHANQVLVYGRAALTTNILNWTPLVTTEGTIYSFTLTYKNISSSISYTVGSSETATTITTAVKALVNASTAGVAGAAATGTAFMVLTGGTTGEPVQISGNNPTLAKILDVSTDAGIATDLAAAVTWGANQPTPVNFYRFVIDSYSEAENNAAAAWAEANSNRFFAQSADSTNVIDAAGTGVGNDFFTALYNRACVVHNGDMAANAGACLVGLAAAYDNGTFGHHYKALAGPAADALTTTQLNNGLGKNILLYALNGSTAQTWLGKAASGRSLRIQDALDLLDARVREACLAVFMSNLYVPMSDAGFAKMEGAVRGVLSTFQTNGIIDSGFTVTVPKKTELSSSDLTAGILRSLKFSCVMPNDMQKVIVSGVVSF
jgi:hypothetical protein